MSYQDLFECPPGHPNKLGHVTGMVVAVLLCKNLREGEREEKRREEQARELQFRAEEWRRAGILEHQQVSCPEIMTRNVNRLSKGFEAPGN